MSIYKTSPSVVSLLWVLRLIGNWSYNMDNYKLTHTIIKIAVENGIRYIQDNPKRGVRNLLDLGEYFASGCFQKSFFNLAHEMLNNEDSSYYTIIENAVKNINHDILTNFGINMGYNSFTYGAKIIRENEKTQGYKIPWVLVLDFREKNVNHLAEEEISDLINQGKNFGIYSYIILINKNNILIDLSSIIKNNGDCAFIVTLNPEIINEEYAKEISNISNLCLLINLDDLDEHMSNIDLLKKYKCLYGGYFYYDCNTYSYITNGVISDKILSMNSNFGVMIGKQNCSHETAIDADDYIFDSRYNNSPVFILDFYEDIDRVNKIISDKACFLSIDSIGQVNFDELENKTEYNIRTNSLKEILKSTD